VQNLGGLQAKSGIGSRNRGKLRVGQTIHLKVKTSNGSKVPFRNITGLDHFALAMRILEGPTFLNRARLVSIPEGCRPVSEIKRTQRPDSGKRRNTMLEWHHSALLPTRSSQGAREIAVIHVRLGDSRIGNNRVNSIP